GQAVREPGDHKGRPCGSNVRGAACARSGLMTRVNAPIPSNWLKFLKPGGRTPPDGLSCPREPASPAASPLGPNRSHGVAGLPAYLRPVTVALKQFIAGGYLEPL